MLSFSYSNKEFTYSLPTLKSEPSNAQNALCRPTNENLYPIICNLLALLCQVHVKQDIPQPNCMAFLWALIVLGKYLFLSLSRTPGSLCFLPQAHEEKQNKTDDSSFCNTQGISRTSVMGTDQHFPL